MKKITIYQEKSEPLVFEDNDPTSISDMSIILSKLMTSSKINILETSTENILIRPSKINSIRIENLSDEKSIKTVIKKEDVIRD